MYRALLLRPGLCPFCLGASDEKPEVRFQHWKVKSNQIKHIEAHLGLIPDDEEIQCPHPRCKTSIYGNKLMGHFETVHFITRPRNNGGSKKRTYEQAGSHSEGPASADDEWVDESKLPTSEEIVSDFQSSASTEEDCIVVSKIPISGEIFDLKDSVDTDEDCIAVSKTFAGKEIFEDLKNPANIDGEWTDNSSMDPLSFIEERDAFEEWDGFD